MAKLEVEIIGDSRSLERAFARSSKAAGNFNKDISGAGKKTGSAFGGLAKVATLGAAGAALGGLGLAAKAAFGEMSQSEKVTGQTNAALKSTGDVANVSKKHVDDLGNSILKKSGIDDEATRTAENMLLTFTNVRNETGKGNKVFDQATKSVADMATRMNGGAIPSAENMQTSALRLGKALNDPIKGIGSLSRVGVQFTKAQKDQIKAMVKSGDTMGAQKVILGELTTEFGGSAEAAGKTFPGQLTILKENLLNTGGAIAEKLVPALSGFLGWVNKNGPKVAKALAPALKDIVTFVRKNWPAISRTVRNVANTVKHIWAAVGPTMTKVMAIAVHTIIPLIKSVARILKGVVELIKGILHGDWATVWKGLKDIVAGAIGEVKTLLTSAVKIFVTLGIALGKGLLRGLEHALEGLGKLLLRLIEYPINGVISAINAIKLPSFSFNTHIPGVGTISTPEIDPFPDIPLLGGGGGGGGAAPAPRRALALAGAGGAGIVVHGGVHVHGVTNPRDLQDAITKNSRGRPVRRRGDP